MSKTLRECGEDEVIRRLSALLRTSGSVKTGIGDDTAVVTQGDSSWDLLLTSDGVLEGTHFWPDAEPERIGHKAIARTLSDIAAMGGEPSWCLIDLVAPSHFEIERLESVYAGVARVAETYELAVVGGDTARGTALALHVFTVGRVPSGKAVLRSGATAGDGVYVTGSLGGSLAGKHLSFEPRLKEGAWLREGGWATAMLDVSDGIGTDLQHLAKASKVHIRIDTQNIPLSDVVAEEEDAIGRAVRDGEDFELLFTVPAGKKKAFEKAWSEAFRLTCTCIGELGRGAGEVTYFNADREIVDFETGYDHFSD